MPGTPFFILAAIGILTAKQCFLLAMPFLAIFGITFLLRSLNVVLNYLFSNWQVDHEMGWLNLSAQRRADAVLRWLGYFVYAILAATLLGIVWAAKGLSNLPQWDDVNILSDLMFRIPVLLLSLAFWGLYLGCELYPKLRNQYEEEELEKYRAEQAELEQERDMQQPSRMKPYIHKSVTNFAKPNRLRSRN